MIRKARHGELQKIIDTANSAFRPVRYESYDFRNRVSKIYSSTHDYSDIHWVDEENGLIVATAGNFIGYIEGYKYSFIGTVSTLPNHQRKGHMTRLISAIDDWNSKNEVVFSVLTGERQRYKNFGFEKSAFRNYYTITRKISKNLQNSKLSVFKSKETETPQLYEIYRKTQHLQVRNKENFFEYINNFSDAYTLYLGESIIGYVIVKKNKLLVTEIALSDLNLLPSAICALFEILDDDEMELLINPLNRDLCNKIESICEEKKCVEELHFKVYDYIKFISLLFNLNKSFRHFNDCREIYKVDNLTLELTVNSGELSITETYCKPQKEFSKTEFVRYIMNSDSFISSQIFPLFFDFNEVDTF